MLTQRGNWGGCLVINVLIAFLLSSLSSLSSAIKVDGVLMTIQSFPDLIQMRAIYSIQIDVDRALLIIGETEKTEYDGLWLEKCFTLLNLMWSTELRMIMILAMLIYYANAADVDDELVCCWNFLTASVNVKTFYVLIDCCQCKAHKSRIHNNVVLCSAQLHRQLQLSVWLFFTLTGPSQKTWISSKVMFKMW